MSIKMPAFATTVVATTMKAVLESMAIQSDAAGFDKVPVIPPRSASSKVIGNDPPSNGP
jgi:hypothetical protein